MHCALRYRNKLRSSKCTGFEMNGRRYRKPQETAEGEEVYCSTYLVCSALEEKLGGRGGDSVSRPDRFITGKLYCRGSWVGPQVPSGRK